MSMSNTFETNILDLIFKNLDAAGIGDATGLRGAAVAGSLYISLHTASPGEAGSQNTNETTYGSYARVAVARSGAAWSVVGNMAENIAAITFPSCTSGTATITHFGIGTELSGAGKLLLYGSLTPSLAVSTGVTPEIAAGELEITAE